MKIVVGDEIYSVKFFYSSKEGYGKKEIKEVGKKALIDAHNRQIMTRCEISKKDTNGQYQLIKWGESIKNKIDKFDKGFGRRQSLTRALNAKGPIDNQIPTSINRETRGIIWAAYMSEHKDGIVAQD